MVCSHLPPPPPPPAGRCSACPPVAAPSPCYCFVRCLSQQDIIQRSHINKKWFYLSGVPGAAAGLVERAVGCLAVVSCRARRLQSPFAFLPGCQLTWVSTQKLPAYGELTHRRPLPPAQAPPACLPTCTCARSSGAGWAPPPAATSTTQPSTSAGCSWPCSTTCPPWSPWVRAAAGRAGRQHCRRLRSLAAATACCASCHHTPCQAQHPPARSAPTRSTPTPSRPRHQHQGGRVHVAGLLHGQPLHAGRAARPLRPGRQPATAGPAPLQVRAAKLVWHGCCAHLRHGRRPAMLLACWPAPRLLQPRAPAPAHLLPSALCSPLAGTREVWSIVLMNSVNLVRGGSTEAELTRCVHAC